MITPVRAALIGGAVTATSLGLGAAAVAHAANDPDERTQRQLITAFAVVGVGIAAATLGATSMAQRLHAAAPSALMGVALGAAAVGMLSFGAAGDGE